MSVINLSSGSKMYYVVYREYGVPKIMEYNIFEYQTARDKAFSWATQELNRMATVFSITARDPSPKKEYEVNNQYVEEVEAQKAS